MFRNRILSLFLLLGLAASAACTPQKTNPTDAPNLPNPASVHCEQNGGKLDLRTDAAGNSVGVCVFPDGSGCEEWAYQRGECKPGDSLAVPEPTAAPETADTAPAAPAEEQDSEGWKIYRNEQLGYDFHYPADASLVTGDDPLHGITITGPVVEGESWPQITISHPGDREDYRPPEDADLETWLADRMLLGDERQPDVQIAGTTAIHTRHARSPQSFAFDRYFFARAGQLYTIVIGHTGDMEDWGLYNRFLSSFEFEQ